MIAALYARYSSDNQREESIVAQIRACREYCKRKGYTIIHEYADEAYSGTNDNRPQFQEMLADADAGKFEILVAHKIDRFGRNAYDFYKNIHRLKMAGVRIEYAAQEITDTPEGAMMQAVMIGVSEWYVLNLSKEIKKGFKENILAGKTLGGIPLYGYDVDRDTKKYVINEHEAAAVRAMFSMYANGKSYGEIINWLNDNGYRTKRGRTFGKNSLHDLFHNRRYIGMSVGGKNYKQRNGRRNAHAPDDENTIIVEGACPVIVEREVFDMVQKRMQENRKRAGAFTARRRYVLSGYVFCDVCGAAMSGVANVDRNGNHRRYYRCGTATKGGKAACKNRAINADDLEALVLEKINGLLYDDGLLELLTERIIDEYGKLQKDHEASREFMQKNRDKARAELDRLYKKMRESDDWDDLDDAELKNAKAIFRGAEKSLDEIRLRGALPEVTPDQIKEYINTKYVAKLKNESTADYRTLLEHLVDSVRVGPENVTVRFKVYLSWCDWSRTNSVTLLADIVFVRPTRKAG